MRSLPHSLALACVLALALVGAAVAATRGADQSRSIKLDRGPIPVDEAFARKRSMGDMAFAAEVDAAISQLEERSEMTDRCESRAETSAAAELALVRRTSNPQTYARLQATADAALAQRRVLRTLYLGGAEAPPPYGLVKRMVARSKTETSPRLAELYRRMAEDQFSHIDSVSLRPFAGPGVHTTWELGLDDAALAYVDAIVTSEWCPMKIASAAWLKADLRAHGWYRISVYGPDADRAAWLIVQHARHDLAFQKEVLAMLEPLWPSGETRGENFAMLYDQTASYDGRPGRFGVIGKCTAPGVWTPVPLEDKTATDAWRTKAGLAPFAEYIATRSRGCIG